MQPYLFPFLGYYQLVHCSDIFVLYDDVTFIKQGYINRNSILANDRPKRVTLPVPGASSNTLIKDLSFTARTAKVLKTLQQAYSKAPYFDDVYPIVQSVVDGDRRSIVDVCREGIAEVFSYLGLAPDLVLSSDIDYDRDASAEDKIVGMCRALGSDDYVNSIGGTELYSHASFQEKGCRLSFLEMQPVRYDQGGSDFVPNLSIIDALMWCGKDEVRDLLDAYVLHGAEGPTNVREGRS